MSAVPRSIPTDWSGLETGAHAVQFYALDDVLLERLTGFIGSALEAGDAAVVVATKAHRESLGKGLRARGIDLAAAARSGQFISLDAAETLAQIVIGGWPNAVLFSNCVGTILGRAAAGVAGKRPRVVVFGEMVSLLCERGDLDAALQLEKLWNNISRTHPFALCCAYCVGMPNGPTREALRAIEAEHSHVVPA